MLTRRAFLATSGVLGTALPGTAAAAQSLTVAAQRLGSATAAQAARDERFWREVRRAFALDPDLLNLNHGNSSSSPVVVHDAFKQYLDATNRLPVHYRGLLEAQVDAVRRRLAGALGCDADELAITRNTTESLHIAQCGLDLRPGDEVLTTDQDYTRMLWAWDQRARRDGVVINRIQFPVPAAAGDLLARFERAMTPHTKALHFCHLTNTTGQLFPVRELCALARQRGIVSIVDGGHAVGHFPFALRDLGCDAYGSSLHKWMMAPHGTGILYVRRDSLERFWPLMPALDSMRGDIRKFEEIGTHPAAAAIAINDALAFHEAIGGERKAQRLRYLTLRWADALQRLPGVRILSSLEAGQTWGLATFSVDGIDAPALARHLFDKHRIIVAAVVSQGRPGPVLEYQGVRVTPNVSTSLGEIDRFVAAVRDVTRDGLPRVG